MTKKELFEQAYCSEKDRGYFCMDGEGKVLWLNETASRALPMLTKDRSAVTVFPGLDTKGMTDRCMLPLADGSCARILRFTETDSESSFFVAEIVPGESLDNETADHISLLSAQMQAKISRIRTLIGESKNSLSDIQADYSTTVPLLAGQLDHQITWISGAEKECDSLVRYLLQAEESTVPAARNADDRTDAGRFLPLLFRDAELVLKEMGVPLELVCDLAAVGCGQWIGCSKERLTVALLGMVRVAAVSAMLREGSRLYLQAWNDGDAFLLRMRDEITDPGQLEAYEPLVLRSGQKLPSPANHAFIRLKHLVDSVGGSWMVGRTPGSTGYTLQIRFPLIDGTGMLLESAVAYRLETACETDSSLSGLHDLVRIMFSSFEDDMR